MWNRLPALIRGVVGGLLVSLAGTVPWAWLSSANLKHWTAVPWSVPLTLGYLWLFWLVVSGRIWPRIGGGMRRESLRANPVPEKLWGPALFAGILGIVTVVILQTVTARLAPMQQQAAPGQDLGQIPFLTLVAMLPTGALVAGVAEEAAFRGYMQGPIERRHGPLVAIFITGLFFGLAHFTHPEVSLLWLPYYVAVAAVYGALAFFTKSIFPSMLLHGGGNLLAGLPLLLMRGAQNGPASPSAQQSGGGQPLWLLLVELGISAAATLMAYRALARAASKLRAG